MDYCVYILRSEVFNRHYYGHTKDIKRRLKKHNTKSVRSTKAYVPWEVIYTEYYKTKSEAYRREMFFKSIDGYNFLRSKNIIQKIK